MFAGIPNMDSFIKNMSISPYIEPDRIIQAVEIDVKKEELNNYKVRPLADEAVLYEGYCVLPKERTRMVEMVADLKRDEKGNPILDEKNGKFAGIELRPRTEKEIKESPDKYIPKQDYINFINEKKKEYGYLKGDNFYSRQYNNISSIAAGGKLEYNETIRSTKKNIFSIIKQFIDMRHNTKKLNENPNIKIGRTLDDRKFLNRKNPYADKKFALAVAEFKKDGLEQYNLKDIFKQFIDSKNGAFLRDKYDKIDKSQIKPKGIHGIKHNDRVAIMSLIIGEQEGFLKEESTRERELLTTAAYYHDIGRIADIGPHARRSARLIKNTDISYLDGKKFSEQDKKIVQLLAEGHEGKDDRVQKLIDKYNIEEADVEMVKNLLSILKDADALDRCRLTINTPLKTVTDLEPQYLRLNSSKRLMEASYGLEYLTKYVSTRDLINFNKDNKKVHYYDNKIDFKERLKIEEYLNNPKIPMNDTIQNVNKVINNEERED